MAIGLEITSAGHLDQYLSDWFAALELSHLEDNITMLSGVLPDQAALHGLLECSRDFNLALVCATCFDRSTQDADEEGDLDNAG